MKHATSMLQAQTAGRTFSVGCCLLAVWVAGSVAAHEITTPQTDSVLPAPRGSVSVGYQFSKLGGYIRRDGTNNLAGDLEGHSALLEVDWALDERLTLSVGLPYLKRQWIGARNHNPTPCQPGQTSGCLTVPHPEAEFIDDGRFHGNWQDWSLGLTYHAEIGAFQVEPLLRLYLPSHEYSHFGLSASGPNLWRLELGADLAKQLAFSNLYYRVGYSYEFWENTLGIDPSKNKARAELGYFLSPRWAVRGLAFGQYGKGRYETDLPMSRTGEIWYQHDRFLRHNHVHAGAGAAFTFWDDYSVSLDVVSMVWGQSILRTDYSGTLTLSRRF